MFFVLVTGRNLLPGQDIHFSQFMSSPLNLNPANTGFFNGTLRVGLNGKNQWQSVTQPYQTLSFAFDMSPLQRSYYRDAFGVGVLVNADIAGDSKFSTTSPALCLSYIRSLKKRSNHLLGVGIMGGWVFRTINYNALYYDNQYNGNYYDPSLGNNELFRMRNYGYFDLGAGVHYLYQVNADNNVFGGFSALHLVPARLSFMGDNSILTDKKWTGYAGAQLCLSETIDILPQALYMQQGTFREILIGCHAKYMRNRLSQWEYISLTAGLFYRNRDAMVFSAGFDYRLFTFGLSYDMNVSRLRPASYYRGGLEFSLIYTYAKLKSRKARPIPCPIF
jgi:type IX secretion system PorP/SprF family membrane protein